MLTLDDANFTHLLPIYGGHFHDLLFQTVGFPDRLVAVTKNQFPITTIAETGEKVPYRSANQVMTVGTLESGALFCVQLEGGQVHRTGLQIDITGTAGALRLTNARAFHNAEHHALAGMNEGSEVFMPLPIPARYTPLQLSHLDASAQEVAYLYTAYAHDKAKGANTAANFEDALRQHQLIDRITKSSDEFFS